MPKEQPVERFRISCEVEAASLGPTVAQLAKLGLTNVHFELIEDVRAFAKKASYEVKTEDLLKTWIADHPTFKAIEACRFLEEQGRTKTSAYPALASLVEQKILKKLDLGNYARADVKQIEPPKAKPKTFDKRGEDVILSYARRNHGRFNTPKVVEIFVKEGRAKNSVYASIDHLMKIKRVKRVGPPGSGSYILLTKPQKKKVAKPAVKANGADHVEAAHV